MFVIKNVRGDVIIDACGLFVNPAKLHPLVIIKTLALQKKKVKRTTALPRTYLDELKC